jgi:hypothetical protein
MEDIDKAQEIVKTAAGNVGMTKAERDKASALLKDYGEKRENVLKAMLLLLGQSDISSLDRDWRDLCVNGREALSKLNDEVPEGDRAGLGGVGLDSFRRGELKIWEENARAEIALAAKQMGTIHLTNVTLIQQCNEELKWVLSDKKDLQTLVEGRFGAITDVLKKTVTFLYAIVQIKRYIGQPSIPDQIKMLGDQLTQSFSQVRDATAKKQALLQVLLKRIDLLKQTKSSLNKDAIAAAYAQAAAVANALPGLGRDSPYDARDWEQFGRDCTEKLEDERDRTITDADALFEVLYHTLDEEMQKSFETLSDDPAQLEKWNDEIGNSFNSIQEALEKVQDYTESLAEGPVRAGLNAVIASANALIRTYVDDWKSTLENIKQALRKG